MEIQVDSGITVKKLAFMRKFKRHTYASSIAEVMYDLAHGHHIVGIETVTGHVDRIMGQSEIFSYLLKESTTLVLPLQQYINDTSFYGSPVKGIDANHRTVDAFDMISKSGFSSTLIFK